MIRDITQNQPMRVFRWVSVMLLALVVVACSPTGDDEEDEPTVVDVVTEAPEATIAETPDPASTPSAQASPTDSMSPTEAMSLNATPAATPAIDDDALVGILAGLGDEPTPDEAAEASPDVDEDPSESDGAVGATPDAEGSAAEPAVVESCNPEQIEPFSGEDPNRLVLEELNFRAGPGADCDELGEPLPVGTEVLLVSDPVVREGDDPEVIWVQIEVDGETGWVAAEFVGPAE